MEKIKEEKSFPLGLHICNLPKFERFEGFVLLKEWKSRRIENVRRMKKWENIKDFNFSHFYLVESEKVEEWKK